MPDSVLAIDVGGTKITVAIVDHAGTIVWTHTEPTLTSGDDGGQPQLHRLIDSALAVGTFDAVGVAVPAVLDRVNGIVEWAPNIESWNGMDLGRAIGAAAGNASTAIEYDGHAGALGESWLGAGQGIDSFVTVSIGTGIGCGIFNDGHLVRGKTGLAGAAGWMMVGQEKTPWESLAGGHAINALIDSVVPPIGAPDRLEALFERALAGDHAANAVANSIAERIGIGIANLVSILDPERVILSGGLGARTGPIAEQIRQAVAAGAQPTIGAELDLVISPLGGSSVMLGAARSALHALEADHNGHEERKQA